jgi:hypothetical protein
MPAHVAGSRLYKRSSFAENTSTQYLNAQRQPLWAVAFFFVFIARERRHEPARLHDPRRLRQAACRTGTPGKRRDAEVANLIAQARGEGDLSENAEYHAQRENQGLLAAKINLLKHKLNSARIVDASKVNKSEVAFGATVKVRDLDFDDE